MFSEEGGPPVPIDDLIRHISHQSEESEDNDTIEFPIQKQHKQLTLDVKVAANEITTNQLAKNRDSVSIQNIPSGKRADPILCQEIQTNKSSEKLPTILPPPLPHVVSRPTVLRPERQISIPPREIDYRRKQQDPPCRGRPDVRIFSPNSSVTSNLQLSFCSGPCLYFIAGFFLFYSRLLLQVLLLLDSQTSVYILTSPQHRTESVGPTEMHCLFLDR